MMDTSHRWVVIENPQDEEIAERNRKNTLEKYQYKTLETYYEQLEPFLGKHTKYLQIGYLYSEEYPVLSGILEINGQQYTLNGFKPETTIDMKLFKQFWKKLTENYKLHDYTSIEIFFYQNKPVWIILKQYNPNDRRDEIRRGIIVPEI